MAQPVSELEFWQAYYSIYPFPHERVDAGAGLVAWSLKNAIDRLFEVELAGYAGKKSFEFVPAEIEKFLPDYLGERKQSKKRKPKEKTGDLSLEQQAAQFKAFANKLKAAQGKR